MLVAGTDINGDSDNGQFRYVAFVIGTESGINTLYNEIGLGNIEMKNLKKPQRKFVAKKMNFTNPNFLAICLKVDRQNLIQYITTHPHSKAKFIEKKEVHRYFDRVLLSLIRDKIDGFCQHHDSRFVKLNFQCDPDMTKTITNWELLNSFKGKAYEFADAISFCYQHKWSPVKGCKYIDYSEKIKQRMRDRFIK